jgi:hypothetical protein
VHARAGRQRREHVAGRGVRASSAGGGAAEYGVGGLQAELQVAERCGACRRCPNEFVFDGWVHEIHLDDDLFVGEPLNAWQILERQTWVKHYQFWGKYRVLPNGPGALRARASGSSSCSPAARGQRNGWWADVPTCAASARRSRPRTCGTPSSVEHPAGLGSSKGGLTR